MPGLGPEVGGSLGTLLVCVRDHRLDLREVELAVLCEAYYHYLLQDSELDVDGAAAVLAALAYLLERKAWLLLPAEVEEPEVYEDDEALPAPDAERYQLAGQTLVAWHEERQEWFFRSTEPDQLPYELPYELDDVSAHDLAHAFQRVLRKAHIPADPILGRPKRSLADQMTFIVSRLNSSYASLTSIFPARFTREDAAYWFLALLELVRSGRARARVSADDLEFAGVP